MRVTGELLQGRGPFLPGSEQRGELCRLGDRPQAGEALAHVGGRAAVDRLAAGEQRDAVFRAAGEDEMWPELAAYDALERPRVRADDRNLLDRREVEVERLQQVRERRRVLGRDLVQQPQDAQRRVLVAMLPGERGQPQQAEGGGRSPRRDRRVLELLAPRDQRLVVVRGREEAAVLEVGEAREDRLGKLARGAEPARVERRLVQRQQRLEQERVVLEV